MAKEQNDALLEVEAEILAAKRARAAYRTVYKEEPEDFVDWIDKFPVKLKKHNIYRCML